MKMAISAWSIRNPIPVAVLFIAITIAGIAAYLGLPIKQFPDTSFPTVQITVTQNGAAPAELETQVTRVAEDAVASIPGVKHVISSVTLGQSQTTVEFEIGEDEQKATDEVRTAIDRVRADFPRTIDEPIVERIEADSLPILTYAVASPGMSATDLSWFVDDTVAGRLQSIEGVANVRRVGGVTREVNIVLDPARLAAYGLTAPAVNEALRSFVADNPGGRTEIGGSEQTVRVLGPGRDVEALRALTLPIANGRTVRLTDVADVGDGASEQRSFARLNGRPVVAFEITKTKPSSDIRVEDKVKAEMDKLRTEHPRVAFTEIVSTVGDTRASFTSTVHVLIEGMVLAAVVVLLFLREWRSTLIAALAMPISLIPTFAVMSALGFSLNLVTLLGLTLVIGILVDDAIVEIENIEKRIERGESPYEASLHGADQIGLAVVATTMTIVVVFLPVSLMGGLAGQYFREFGLTVAVAVLFSLLVARMLTPLLTAYFLVPAKHAKPRKPFTGVYRKVLEWAIGHPKMSLLFGVLFFIGSLGLASLIPTGFVPTSNPTSLVLDVQASPGTTRNEMDNAVRDLTRVLRRDSDVELVFANVGGQDFTTATATVVFREDRTGTTSEFRNRIRPVLRSIPGVRVNTFGESGTPADVEITLVGRDGVTLAQTAQAVQRDLRTLPMLANVRPVTPESSPELVIRPRMEEAARLGVTAEDLATIARVATIGDVDANVAKVSAGERRIPVRASLPDRARADLDALRNLEIPTASGKNTRLEAVADISFEAGPGRIERFDRERRETIRADLRDGATLGQALEATAKVPTLQALPAGVRQAEYGDAEAFADLFGGFIAAMLAGVGLMFGVLVLLFKSFFKPVTILTALPLSLGGAFAALLLTNLALTLPAMIGLLMLLGLAAKNSILLVEFAIEREREGMSQHDALIEACRERARPIVMTTIAMAAGMLPTALGYGEGAEFRQPMAVGVIGGLISSTVLSLVLVPVVYEFVDNFEMWLAPRLGRLITKPPRDAHMIVPESERMQPSNG
ncbi:efflux RND transporter permease subunit [Blastomonas sp. UPD001]|uniref:efflux RND transporter permease subunit n=1 Tax=Blastomonas sp. UPD001 TaxID=2217673 RepID=UPI000E34F43F|nr:efflux RND transporter permease subunit [Blastomonas sp. UPD001]